jgi:hypothetical protein
VKSLKNKAFFLTILLIACTVLAFSRVVLAQSSSASIAINYSTTQVQQIWNGFSYDTPSSGNTWLIVNVTITNNGYDSFDTNPTWFHVVAKNIAYNYDPETFTVNNWSTVSVLSGGTYSGALVFQVPVGSTISAMKYTGFYGAFQSYNIIWNGLSSVSATSTASPSPSPTIPEFSSLLAILTVFMVAVSISVLVMVRKK